MLDVDYLSHSSCLERDLQETRMDDVAIFLLEDNLNYEGEGGVSSRCAFFGCVCHIPPSGDVRWVYLNSYLSVS